jgi:chromosome segregation ATPase
VIAQARRDRDAAVTALRQARAALGDALTAVDIHHEEVAAARRHCDAVRAVLVTAQADLEAAETDLGETQRAADEAQQVVQSAQARLRQADAQMARGMGR